MSDTQKSAELIKVTALCTSYTCDVCPSYYNHQIELHHWYHYYFKGADNISGEFVINSQCELPYTPGKSYAVSLAQEAE